MGVLDGPHSTAKFLGATVVGFDCNAGWNDQGTTATFRLVEDHANGDRFRPPAPGSPVKFSYENFVFEGVLQLERYRESIQGKEFEVIATGPHEILDAAKVIVDSVSAPIPVPNVLNVYGMMEAALGFGGAMANESGMLWNSPFSRLNVSANNGGGIKIKQAGFVGVLPALQAMMKGRGGLYGGPIRFKGHAFPVDFSGLPPAPEFYRMGGTTMSLLEMVSRLCQDAGYDYQVRLKNGVIVFNCVARTSQPPLGTIANYVMSQKDAISKEYGVELRNDYTNAVLIGDHVTELVQVANQGGGNAIVPFWGLDANGQVVTGTGTPETHYEVDLPVNDQETAALMGGLSYHVTVPELRCALADYDSWAYYVMKWEPKKAKVIGIQCSIDSDSDLATLFPDGTFRRDLIAQGVDAFKRFGEMNESDYWTNRANRVYSFVRRYAEEFFGSKFLVRVPFFLYWKMVPETYQVVSSMEVSQEGGYLPEGAQPLGLPYFDVDKFMTDDDRFRCFVQFPFSKDMDLSNLHPDEATVSNGNLYVRAEVDPTIYYLQGSVYPHVVVTLAKPVYQLAPDPLGGIDDIAKLMKVPVANLGSAIAVRHGSFPVRITPPPFRPTSVAVPMRDNRSTYGPWGTFGTHGAYGPAGKAYVEVDQTLNPWNYGGYDYLNAEAAAKLAGMATAQQEAEVGAFEVPGAPRVQPGDALVQGGPEVTGISVRFGTSGVTTSYSMQTYTPQFGAFHKANADRLRRLGLMAMQSRKMIRAMFLKRLAMQQAQESIGYGFMELTAHSVRQRSPIDSIYATMTATKAGYRTQASFAQLDEFMANVRADKQPLYWATGGVSLEGIFRPFSTGMDRDAAGDMPHFTRPLLGLPSSSLSSYNLNPFVQNSDTDILLSGKDYTQVRSIHRLKSDPTHGVGIDYTNARPVGLRGPICLVGFGAEYTGKPFPNKGDETKTVDQWSDNWTANYQQHPERFRAGPLEVYFDTWRGVWTFPTMIRGVLQTDLEDGQSAMMSIIIGNTTLPDQVKVWNGLGGTIKSGTKAFAFFYPLEKQWYVGSAACPN